MKIEKNYYINKDASVNFKNNVDYCVGTGRMGLALQKEYQDQLELVQKEIGFKYIRGHGLFSDDMAICQQYIDSEGNRQIEYNFTYLDLVMDFYRRIGIRPFLELGFMPQKIASGEQTVFYWKGNVTPPQNYKEWSRLIQATLRHFIDRYGLEEVINWPIEVWNEPNLPGFWKDADMEEYFKLFQCSFQAVKEVDSRFRVGGPAICGVDDERWIRCFMEYCEKENIPLDFVTRHHYTSGLPKVDGHYGYIELLDAEEGYANLQTTRDIVDSFPEYKGMEIHITEFNTSYIPNCPLHDTNQNAAYIAGQLSRLGDMNESYSYWTFGDVFEELGVPFAPFHGGFGMVANGCIPKPTFWTFQFFKNLKGVCIHRSDEAVVVKRKDNTYCGVVWNTNREREDKTLELQLNIELDSEEIKEEYFYIEKVVDEESCNPLKVWHDMGEPISLTAKQKELLKSCSTPKIISKSISAVENSLRLSWEVAEHGVIYFEIKKKVKGIDRGYDYKRVTQIV